MTTFVKLVPVDMPPLLNALLALVRLQLPSGQNSASGLCVLHFLTSSSKVVLEIALQIIVGIGMVVLYQGVNLGKTSKFATVISLLISKSGTRPAE